MEAKAQGIRVVILCKSRHVGNTVQEGEVSNSLTGEGPDSIQELLQRFFSLREFDTCSLILENGDCVQFIRENGEIEVALPKHITHGKDGL